ncbi:MAG: class I SAM-dependent methyltransferase [Thermomicrobiales bacterium]
MNSVETFTITPEMRDTWRTDTKREWSDAQKVDAWRKWGRTNIAAQRDATAALLEMADLRPGMRVLDAGGGGGDPSLAAAAAVRPGGQVTVTDVSQGMLDTAREYAREDGLTNLDYRIADTEDLPFADASFDRALCRCVVMFFPDDVGAASEIRRVLKPGGKATFLAWGPLEQNPLFSGMFFSIGKILTLPQPPPGTPGPFKFAAPGSLSDVLTRAGFAEIEERAVNPLSRWALTPEVFVDLIVEMGGLHWLLQQMTDEERGQALRDATDHYRSFWNGRTIDLPLACVLASGTEGGTSAS